MPTTSRLTDTLNFQGQALTLRAERQRVLASNIANADTPGYVARDFDFAGALRAATSGLAAGGVLGGSQLSAAQAALQYAHPAQDSVDRNTVDMDRERAAMAENTLKVDAAIRFLNGHVRTLTEAMKPNGV